MAKSLSERHKDGQHDKSQGKRSKPPYERALDVINPFLRNDDIKKRSQESDAYKQGYNSAKKSRKK